VMLLQHLHRDAVPQIMRLQFRTADDPGMKGVTGLQSYQSAVDDRVACHCGIFVWNLCESIKDTPWPFRCKDE
jgi:hypothetical protein